MIVNWSSIAACLGRCSQMTTPGSFVCVTPNGPRLISGRSGLVSQVSMWLGPPAIHSRMQLLFELARPSRPPQPGCCKSCGKLSPASPAMPAFNIPRRLTTHTPSSACALEIRKGMRGVRRTVTGLAEHASHRSSPYF